MSTVLGRWIGVVALGLTLGGSAAAQSERILDYESRFVVNPDGSLEVRETITVQAGSVLI